MRVVHVISGLGQGGAEAMVEKLVLAARRHEPQLVQEVVSLGELGVVGRRLVEAGISVHALHMKSAIDLLARLPSLAARLRPTPGDVVVQTWLWHADLFGGVAARLVGNRRVVWNLRNAVPIGNGTRTTSILVTRLCAWLSRWLPARIVCNADAAREAHCAIGYAREKCVVVPNGFDLVRFHRRSDTREQVRRRWDVNDDQLVVGLVARVDPLKDHRNFLLAAAQVAERIPNIRFLLVGDGVDTDRGLRQLVVQLGLADRVVFEPRQEDVSAVMSAFDIFCLSSRSEGFPNVLGEAMACETPSVSTDCGDARSILGDDTLVAPVEDPAALADRVMRVATLDPVARRELGRRQRQRVQEHFDIDRVWLMYRDLYERL